MELLPPTVFKEEFHEKSHVEINWNRGENNRSHHSSKQEYSENIKNESKNKPKYLSNN